MKPTRGPWTNEIDGSVVMNKQVVLPVLHCGPDGSPIEERVANARLFAAAPDMLNDLIMAEEVMRQYNLSDDERELLRQIQRTIAKAEGRKD